MTAPHKSIIADRSQGIRKIEREQPCALGAGAVANSSQRARKGQSRHSGASCESIVSYSSNGIPVAAMQHGRWDINTADRH